jgi:hypothetical protein
MYDVRDRVIFALLAQASATGRIEKWSASEGYAAARCSRDEFERTVAMLEGAKDLTVDRSSGRRRFQLAANILHRAAEAKRFLDTPPGASALAFTIENLARKKGKPGGAARLSFTLRIGDVATVDDCVYVAVAKPFVAGPAVYEMGTKSYRDLVRFGADFEMRVRLEIERRVASQPTLLYGDGKDD